MAKKRIITEKGGAKRFGSHCENCSKKLGEFKLTGRYNNKSMSFCNFRCMDDYKEKNPPLDSKNT